MVLPCRSRNRAGWHFRLGECYFKLKDRADAVNEFTDALKGDLEPSWVIVWSHVNRGKIFDTTGQRERALSEYEAAEKTKDKTQGALDEVAKYRQTPFKER
jgi:tetratricopeptide (TPR) repeat protein